MIMMFFWDEDGFLQWISVYAECPPPCLFAVCTLDPSESRTSHFNCVNAPPFYGMSICSGEYCMSLRTNPCVFLRDLAM